MDAGYLITLEGSTAMDLYAKHREVRFVATLSTGEGFVAFDEHPEGFEGLGHLLTYEKDEMWPWYRVKMVAGTGLEVFSLVAENHDVERFTTRTLVFDPQYGRSLWLIEDEAPVEGATWTGAVESFIDRRVALV